MTQKRKIISAADLTKILRDEKNYNDSRLGQLTRDNNDLNLDPTRLKNQPDKVEPMDYYFNLLNCSYDLYHDVGTVTDVEESSSENGYDLANCGDAFPNYGAIIPAASYPAAEKISTIRFSIPVHIQFYEEEDESYPVKGEIILLFGDSLEDVKQVANLCGYEFTNWIGWIDHSFVLIADVEA